MFQSTIRTNLFEGNDYGITNPGYRMEVCV